MSAKPGPKPKPLAERFWSKADRSHPDGCWLWTSNRHHNGYGQIAASRDGATRQRWLWAHRVAWELTHGQAVPDGMVVCHHCDTPLCVNPSHLFLGTQRDNIRDAVQKGRLLGRPRTATGRFAQRLRVRHESLLEPATARREQALGAFDPSHQASDLFGRRSA